MKKYLMFPIILALLMSGVRASSAHCDAVDGPVATAAIRALETENLNVVLPYVPPEAEPEMTTAFQRALAARRLGSDAKALADRYFMETAVRLHRAGEGAPYTGLRPAGTDFGPAIPAAEEALESGDPEPVIELLVREIREHAAQRLAEARNHRQSEKDPMTSDEVPAARARVKAELEFIGYIEGVYLAIRGSGHAESDRDRADAAQCK